MHQLAAEALSAENCLPSGHPVKGALHPCGTAALPLTGSPACGKESRLQSASESAISTVRFSTFIGSLFRFERFAFQV